jgi:hypothetical protein
VQVVGNRATGFACGGIEVNSGNLNLTRGWVEGNSAPQLGGGLCTGGPGSVRMAITDTNVLNNHAADGGGVFAANSFFSTRSAIYRNTATRGAGLYVYSLARLENTTLSQNFAGRDGGGLYAAPLSSVRLNSVTVAANYARNNFPGPGVGGGIFISDTAVVTVANTLLALNFNSNFALSHSDCYGTLQSAGYNFIGHTGGCTITGYLTGNQLGGSGQFDAIDPLVEPLGWITGLTPGLLPRPGSPLINAATPLGCISAAGSYLVVDQISHLRELDGRCDIGAIESFPIVRLYLPDLER